MMKILIALLLLSSAAYSQDYGKGYFKRNDSLFLGSGLGDSIFIPSAAQTAVIVRDTSKFQTTMSIGTNYTTSPLTVTNFTSSFPTPQVGTMVHIISDNVVNGRVSMAVYTPSTPRCSGCTTIHNPKLETISIVRHYCK